MADVTINPKNDGPLHIRGKVKIVTDGGREIAVQGEETWLCRCGGSGNKPFCDGSHSKGKFRNNLDAKK